VRATAIICDYAQVHAGKMYLIGAPANLLITPAVGPPHPISAAIGIFVTIPWNAHNQVHRLKVSLVDEDGQNVPFAQSASGEGTSEEDAGSFVATFNAGRHPMMHPGDDTIMPVPMALNIAVPALGGYVVKVDLDGNIEAEAKFRVMHAALMPGAVPL
jgi:hypothetical protein